MRYITHEGIKYRIRGNYTASQLRELYQGIINTYPKTKLTFRGWLVGHGKIYNRVSKYA